MQRNSGCSPFSIIVLVIAVGIVLVCFAYPNSQFNPFHSAGASHAPKTPYRGLERKESHLMQQQNSDIPLVRNPRRDCAWCHKAIYGTPFPVGLSSTICFEHSQWMCEQAKAYKATRREQANNEQTFRQAVKL